VVDREIEAIVPGSVHLDLLREGLIPDPFFRENETEVQWVAENDWVYEKTFWYEPTPFPSSQTKLVASFVDTMATFWLNGTILGVTNNQFRTWEFDVVDLIQNGENRLRVLFRSPVTLASEMQSKRFLFHTGIGHHRLSGVNHLRKSQSSFGWDWGPRLATIGLQGEVFVEDSIGPSIASVYFRQIHEESCVRLSAETMIAGNFEAGATVTFRLQDDTEQFSHSNRCSPNDPFSAVELTVPSPKLWWPNGLGRQFLYRATVSLYSPDGVELDTVSHRIGLRTLRLERHPDEWGESFQFEVNGTPFFAKGANWIPADSFVSRIEPERYEQLVADAAAANMNFLRVWGGGVYEPDRFYQLCDEYGICVWQDFMFACSAYPNDHEFLNNVRQEAIQQVTRLRNHPSIALWCGNNELEQIPGLVGDAEGAMAWTDYQTLFDQLLPSVVSDVDPMRDYWPSSPHSPCGERTDWANPTCGDAHLWDVWHGRKPFEWYRTCTHRFNSEFGFQSFPAPQTVNRFTIPRDRNIVSAVMEFHQRSPIGNDAIIQYMLDWFPLPESHELVVWASQLLQGLAMQFAVEHWRRSMPRGMGTLYWQLNDCWPCASWSSIDYFGIWKALHFFARGFYSPVLVSAVENWEEGSIDVFLTNDLREGVHGVVRWKAVSCSGDVIRSGSMEATVAAGVSVHVQTICLREDLSRIGPHSVLTFLEFEGAEHNGKQCVSENLALFCRPKHLELRDPTITAIDFRVLETGVEFTVRSEAVGLWVWLEHPAIAGNWKEQFFHLQPDRPRSIFAELSPKEIDAFLEMGPDHLRIRSLFSFFPQV